MPDDYIDPKTLNPLARSYLREAFPGRGFGAVRPREQAVTGCPVRMTV